MKKPIEWHKENLAVRKENHDRRIKEHERVLAVLNSEALAIHNLEFQIQCAEAEGKDGFDRERYLKPRRKG